MVSLSRAGQLPLTAAPHATLHLTPSYTKASNNTLPPLNAAGAGCEWVARKLSATVAPSTAAAPHPLRGCGEIKEIREGEKGKGKKREKGRKGKLEVA